MRASSAARLSLCPGSYKAEDGLPDTTSEASERGTRIHAWLAECVTSKKHKVKLSTDELITANELWDKVVKLCEVNPDCTLEAEKEVECGCWTGHIDLVIRHGNRIILADYKTGYGDVPDPEINAQLRAYAVMVWQAQDIEYIECHIIKPGKCPPPVRYTIDDLKVADMELTEIGDRCMDKHAIRIPGHEQCHWCKALGNPERCPESCKLPSETATLLPTVAKSMAVMRQADLDKLVTQVQLVAKLGKQAIDELRRRLEENPDCSEVYTLGPEQHRREITDMEAVFLRLPDEVVFPCMSISLNDAAKELAKVQGLKAKDGPAALAKLLDGLIVDKPIARKLELK